MDRIHAARRQRGWSQTDLAERAGVTRQMVSAVEAGRHVPNVQAALGLARALETSVEALFSSTDETAVEPVLDAPTRAGTPIISVAVGTRVVGVPLDHAVAPEAWALADAVTTGDDLAWMPDGSTDGIIIAGCDPVIGLLAALVARRSSDRVVPVHTSTARAIEALAAGRLHGVLVHAPVGHIPKPPVAVERWRVARWQVGLATSNRSGPPSIEQVATGRLRVVQRESGAGSQRAFERALQRVGADRAIPGPVAGGHLDVARRVANGPATAGVTMEAAARAFDLGFAPLETHEVELWLDARWLALPASRVLVEQLGDAAFTRRASALSGYDLAGCGTSRREPKIRESV